MIWTLAIAAAIGLATTLLVIWTADHHAHWSADHDQDGPQKMHAHVVPRVGGVGIAAGLVAGVVSIWFQQGAALGKLASLTLVCAIPACAFGLIEDFTKAVSPRRRLVAASLSAVLGIVLLDAQIQRTDWAALDAWLIPTGLGALLTILAVAGIVNAVNIIDGMNGLASMSAMLSLLALWFIANQVGDPLVAGLSVAALGACAGFFLCNYPRGLIFLGDGGAYLLGFLVAELGLLLTQRNPTVSPYAPLCLVAYPVLETLFTMYRRKVLKGKSVSQPDGIHLHTLIYRRLTRRLVEGESAQAKVRANSHTSPYLWALNLVVIVPTMLWWQSSRTLALAAAVFVIAYVYLYWRIVRFQTPRWLSVGLF